MAEHANRYLASGGTRRAHVHDINEVPGRGRDHSAGAAADHDWTGSPAKSSLFPLFYGTDGDSYFVVASKKVALPNILDGTAISSPARGWSRVPSRDQEGEGAGPGQRRSEERARLWEKRQLTNFWPPYADYKLKTEREIPVVVLEPCPLSALVGIFLPIVVAPVQAQDRDPGPGPRAAEAAIHRQVCSR